MGIVQFFQEDVENPLVEKQEEEIQQWINQTILQESNKEPGTLSIVFCSDEYLLDMNTRYLDHDYYTDIITFPYQSSPLTADLYVSTDRVRENAKKMNQEYSTELFRVIIHGILHLCGYDDKTPEEEKEMRTKENQYLQVLLLDDIEKYN